MGGSGILSSRSPTKRATTKRSARTARYVSFALAATCPIVLIKHLGRPERFLYMMRIVKFKSVMSMGVWGLVAFSLPATAAAAAQLVRDGRLPRGARLRTRARATRAHESRATRARRVHRGLYGRALKRDGESALGDRQTPHPGTLRVFGHRGRLRGEQRAALAALFGGNVSTSRKLDRLEAVAFARGTRRDTLVPLARTRDR